VLASAPGMSEQRYMAGFDKTNALVNVLVGVANEAARIAIAQGVDAIKSAGLYKQRVKMWVNETERRQNVYEALHFSNFGDRRQLYLDLLDRVEDEFGKHIFNFYMSVKQCLDKFGVPQSEVKARVECGRVMATLAVAQFDVLMRQMKKETGVDYTGFFLPGRYTAPLQSWTEVADIIVVDKTKGKLVDLNSDANCMLAMEILSRKLNDADEMEKMCLQALEINGMKI